MNSIKGKTTPSNLKVLLWLAPLVIISGVYYIGALLLGFDSHCVFKNSLGMPCPGCGMTRSLWSVAQGQFESAFFWHPLWPLVLAGISIFFYWCLFKCGVVKSFRFFNNLIQSNLFWLSMLFLFVFVYVIRMYLYFPLEKPLDYETNNLLLKIFKVFKR